MFFFSNFSIKQKEEIQMTLDDAIRLIQVGLKIWKLFETVSAFATLAPIYLLHLRFMNEQGKEDFEQNLWEKSGTWLRF